MATVYGVVANYVNDDYIVSQTDYVLGPAELEITASATAIIEQVGFVRGGSIEWNVPTSWAAWTRNRWSPGIPASMVISASSTATRVRSGTAVANLALTASSTGNVTFSALNIAPQLTITTSSTGNVTFSARNIAPQLTLTAVADARRTRGSPATAQLTITADADARRTRGSPAVANLVLTTDATGVVRLTGTAVADLILTADATGQLRLFGQATANLVLTTTLTGGLVQKPSNPNTTYSVPSETRIYVTEHDAINDSAGLHLGHNYYKLPINVGETRVYKVLTDTRTATVPSETRIQPTEVF